MIHNVFRLTVFISLSLRLDGAEPDVDAIMSELAKPVIEKKPHLALSIGVVTPKIQRTFHFGKAKLEGKDRAPDDRTIYEIGSITKVFTGTLLAQLVLEKKIRLDEPVQPWLPKDWVLPRRDERDITFLHLATHTSGLPVQPPGLPLIALASGNAHDPYGEFDSPLLIKSLASTELDSPIGSKHRYSNLGVGLLGHALAKADNKANYHELLSKRVFEPLSMKDSTIPLSDAQMKRNAPGHDAKGKQVSGWNFATLGACGGIRSTPHDMLLFAQAAMPNSESSLKPAFAFAQQPWRELPLKNVAIGLCWMRSKEPHGLVIWHNGGTGGYASFMGVHPKSGVGVVILCNGAERVVDEIGTKIIEKLTK